MVHWDRKGARRRVMIQIGILLALLSIIGFAYEKQSQKIDGDAKTLELVKKEVLPLKEISGVARFLSEGQYKTVLIGDDKARVYWLEEGREQSFKDSLVERFSLCQSEDFDECDRMIKKLSKNWESLATDGEGRLFLLQEHPQSILVTDPLLNSFQRVLHYNFADAFDSAVAKGAKKVRKNALGEGLILLKNGHILVAKENYPVALVEFGPEGDDAIGLNATTVLAPGESFSFRSENFHQKLVPLHSWTLATHGKCDISDLALDKDQMLLALSEVCLTIQRYEALVPGEQAKLKDVYVLPGEIQSPEALTVDGDEWLVGSDVSSKKVFNFYRLKAESGIK